MGSLFVALFDILFAARLYKRAKQEGSWRWSQFFVTMLGIAVTFFVSASPMFFLSNHFIDRHTGAIFVFMFCTMLLCIGGLTLVLNRMRRSQNVPSRPASERV